MNKKLDTTLFDRAAKFAIDAHSNTERRQHGSPYALHVFEAAAIVETMSNDMDLIAAALLHDVVEDTDVTIEEIESEFGKRIADLVSSETEEVIEGSPEDTWVIRKQHAMDRIASASHEGKIVALGDKLSNMRAIYRDYQIKGPDFFNVFHVKDPKLHEWHYRGLAEALIELQDQEAYKEFVTLIDLVFSKQEN